MSMQEKDTEILEEADSTVEETVETSAVDTKEHEAEELEIGEAEAEEADAEGDEDKEEESSREATDENEASDEKSPKSWAEKKAAKKAAKQDKKEEAFQEKIDQLEDRVKRQMAEFENFRKRTEREKDAMFETGAKSVIEKILPVVDNFERGLATVPEEQADDPFVDGMNRIYKQLLTELDNMGVKPIEAVGCEFNPELHNAVMQVDSEEHDSGVIVQELQKGYTYRDSVVRHSMVSVAS